jgi:hypothetical protein
MSIAAFSLLLSESAFLQILSRFLSSFILFLFHFLFIHSSVTVLYNVQTALNIKKAEGWQGRSAGAPRL